jgi:hypothetical protein
LELLFKKSDNWAFYVYYEELAQKNSKKLLPKTLEFTNNKNSLGHFVCFSILLKFGAIQGRHQLIKSKIVVFQASWFTPSSSLCQRHEFNGLCKWQVLFGLMNHVS